jgi:hypothetical protein
MNSHFSSPMRTGDLLRSFERLDAALRHWALDLGCEEHRFPVLINGETLRRAEYPNAFPHLLMAPAVAVNPDEPFTDANVRLADWFLSPAVCYHAYAALEGRTLETGQLMTARGCCFRNETPSELAPGRRQVEFEMRELILVGAPAWIDALLAAWKPGVEAQARQCGFQDAAWQAASDPFFLPMGRGKAHMQRLLGTKLELCLPDGLAIASINRHGSFFGERFRIRTADGALAHSGCVAFGLDRWATHQTTAL